MGTDDKSKELLELQVQQAKAELANTVAEGAMLQQQVKSQRAQLHGQMVLAVLSIVTAGLAAWSSCRADRRSVATYQAASAAVSSMASAQQQQYQQVEQLRDYTVELVRDGDGVQDTAPSCSASAAPLVSAPPVRTSRRKPATPAPPAPAPPPAIMMPPAPE